MELLRQKYVIFAAGQIIMFIWMCTGRTRCPKSIRYGSNLKNKGVKPLLSFEINLSILNRQQSYY